jgi:hypothetical protein
MHTLATRASHLLAPTGLFQLANTNYLKTHPGKGFTEHHSQFLPSQWATHVIGQNILLAMGEHLYTAISKVNTNPTKKTYATAASLPLHPTPRFHLPTQYFYFIP